MNNLSYLIKQGIRSVWKNRFMSFASLCIMTVSLILVGMSAIVMLDCGIILDNVSDKNEISVYLNDDADIKHIGEVLKSNTLTEKVDFVSAEEGLKKMIEQYSEQKELFENLPYNPVPATYMVTINDLDKISTAVQQFTAIDGVYKVNAPMDFAGFIKDLRTTFTIIGIVLSGARYGKCYNNFEYNKAQRFLKTQGNSYNENSRSDKFLYKDPVFCGGIVHRTSFGTAFVVCDKARL